MGKWSSDGSQYIDNVSQMYGKTPSGLLVPLLVDEDGSLLNKLTGSNVPNTQALPIKLYRSDGVEITSTTTVDGAAATMNGLLTRSYNYLYNGSTLDLARSNAQGTLLASAARTASAVTPTQTNYNAKGVMLFLDVTAVGGTGGLVVRIFGVDPVSGKNIPINGSPPVVTAVGTTAYALYPGITSANQRGDNYILPRQWNVQVQHQDGTSYTYTLGYALIL